MQRQGYAAAITHPEVLRAIEQGFDQRIAVTYVEWGDARSQDVVVPWTIIDGKDSAAAFAQTLMERPRRAFGPNAIGSAITVAQALIEGNAYEGYRKVIDLSADSANSWDGISLAVARQSALMADIVINGLAVLCRSCSGRPNSYDLEAAFAERIIGGPASFVVTAENDDQFAEAVRPSSCSRSPAPCRPPASLPRPPNGRAASLLHGLDPAQMELLASRSSQPAASVRHRAGLTKSQEYPFAS